MSILEEIVERIRKDENSRWEGFDRVSSLDEVLANPKRRMPQPLRFDAQDRRLLLIGEVKQASPSQGIICHPFHPVQIAQQYQQAGVDAISVLTEKNYFKGHIKDLQDIRAVVSVPLLRKDFIIHPFQVHEAYKHGADLVLLIAALHSAAALRELYSYIVAFGMQALVEVHNEEEMERALSISPTLIGINNRDLHTFHVDLRTTERLASLVPSGICIVAESGITSQADALFLQQSGADALLVGQGILQSRDYAASIASLQLRGGAVSNAAATAPAGAGANIGDNTDDEKSVKVRRDG